MTQNEADSNGIVDWRDPRSITVSFPPDIIGELLHAWREGLEQIVAPYVTTKKTDDITAFKGKRRYISADSQRTYQAVYALQSIYRLMAAREKGDIDAITTEAFSLWYCMTEHAFFELWGVNADQAVAQVVHYRQERRTSRLGKTKLRDIPTIVLQATYRNHRDKKNWAVASANELRERHGVNATGKLFSTELKRRGIICGNKAQENHSEK